MPKIRGIKPEFWTDEKVVEVSPLARLLFIGMWNHACDNGHLEDRAKQLKLRILPADDADVAQLLDELAFAHLIVRDAGYIIIPTLKAHQNNDKRYFLTCDFPGCREGKPVVRTRMTPPPDPNEPPPPPDVYPLSAPRAHTVGPACAQKDPTQLDGDGDGDGDGDNSCAPEARATATPDRFEEFWDAYDKKRDRKKATQKWKLALKKPGVTADLLISAATAYIEAQRRAGDHPQFTKDPTTWLNGECWENDLPTPTDPAADDEWGPRKPDVYSIYDGDEESYLLHLERGGWTREQGRWTE